MISFYWLLCLKRKVPFLLKSKSFLFLMIYFVLISFILIVQHPTIYNTSLAEFLCVSMFCCNLTWQSHFRSINNALSSLMATILPQTLILCIAKSCNMWRLTLLFGTFLLLGDSLFKMSKIYDIRLLRYKDYT